MNIQFLNSIPLSVISGGNIYNKNIIEGLKQKSINIDYNHTPSNKNYDISIVDSLCMQETNTNLLKSSKRIIALIHLIPDLRNEVIDFYRANAQFIVTGIPTKHELIAKWQLDSKNVSVIRPGIPNHWTIKNRVRTSINRIMINANIIKRKRYEWLIPILKNVNQPNIKIDIIGNDKLEPNYAKSVYESLKNTSIKNSINFYINISQEEIYNRLNDTDLFLSLSKYETFGMSIFEAVTMGIPCIAFDTGDIDLFKQYPNYINIENHNIEKFTTEFKNLCEGKIADFNFTDTQLPKLRTWSMVTNEFKKILEI